jgi:hypothetical protein
VTDRRLCGWRVASDIPLSDLPPWSGDGRPADLILRLGDVPPLPDPVEKTPLLQIGDDGVCRFEVPAVAAYRVDQSGREVAIDPHMPTEAPDVRTFLLGTVFAIVCFRRGLLPLHASCVRIGEKAVAFAGPSGAGKSTMAATFLKRGHAILADDVAVIDPDAPGGPLVWPALPRLKLWRDMMDGLAIATNGLERVRTQLEKYHLPVEDAFAEEPLPLASVYHLAEARDKRREETRPLSGVDAFLAMERAVYRLRLGRRLLGREAIFAAAGKVAGAVSCIRLVRLVSLERAGEIADEIVRREG